MCPKVKPVEKGRFWTSLRYTLRVTCLHPNQMKLTQTCLHFSLSHCQPCFKNLLKHEQRVHWWSHALQDYILYRTCSCMRQWECETSQERDSLSLTCIVVACLQALLLLWSILKPNKPMSERYSTWCVNVVSTDASWSVWQFIIIWYIFIMKTIMLMSIVLK